MKIYVVGGGASGMVAAISAAKRGHQVTILEHKDRIGKKILATGNGRCNLSNSALINNPWEAYGDYDEEFVKSIFEKFSYEDTIRFFNELGLITKNREELIYPFSDQASAVLDVLRIKIRELNINVICDINVKSIIKREDFFEIEADKKRYRADRVILATGSKAQPKSGSDGSGYEILKKLGHRINDVRPGLVQLKCRGDYFKALSGTRIKARLSLKDGKDIIYTETGEVQFTNYGISGIVSMNLSNRLLKCKADPSVIIDMMPEYSDEEVLSILKNKIKSCVDINASELLIGIMPKKISEHIIKMVNITYNDPATDISEKHLSRIVNCIKRMQVFITGTNGFDEAQICLGGVDISEIKDTMESRIISGLYLCGEVLNLHGNCGGYNLQLAWSTGYIAGCLN